MTMQEIIAIILVTVVVGFALYRRWRKRQVTSSACPDCDHPQANHTDQKTVHFYRKQD